MNESIGTADKETNNPSLPVYEARLIDEKEPAPVQPLSYKLGKAAGSVIALTGFLYRIGRMFIPRRPEDVEGRGGSKRRRRRRRQQ